MDTHPLTPDARSTLTNWFISRRIFNFKREIDQ